MNNICLSCGNFVSSGVSICDECNDKFKEIEAKIRNSENSDYLKFCKYCGRPFEGIKTVVYSKTGKVSKRPTKRVYCSCHYSQCKVCGKPIKFTSDSPFVPYACSNECRKLLRAASSKNTMLEKYGVEYAMQSNEVKEKLAKNNIEKYGVACVLSLDDVKDKVKMTMNRKYGCDSPMQNDKIKQRVLSKLSNKTDEELSSINNRRKQTMLDRYGVENAAQSKEIQNKIKETCMTRLGYASPFSSPAVIQKSKETKLNRYGTEYPIQLDSIKKKREQTCIKKFGVKHCFQDPTVRQKIVDTQTKLYGGYGNASPVIKKKYEDTCLSRYGVANPNKLLSIQEHKKASFIEKYGTDHPMKSDIVREKVRLSRIMNHAEMISDEAKRQNYISFCLDPRSYILNNFDHKPSLVEISETIGNLDCTSVSSRIPPNDHSLLGRYTTSMERAVISEINKICPDCSIKIHDRSLISPYEIDIYLPDFNIGIECNPTSTHNSTINVFSKDNDTISADYHKMKTDMCEKRGIFLFHIFGYEWENKRKVIVSMLRNVLQKNEIKYYARNLSIRSVDYELSKSFLNSNHLQGSTNAKVRLGLFTNDDRLVSLMTFNSPRNTIGKTKRYSDGTWELSRFCNLAGCSVVGGASKLFNHFINLYHPSNLISFSDRSHTRGKLYEKLGFQFDHISSPSYVWVNIHSDGYLNRVQCQKQNIRNTMHDVDIDIENETESMIMSSRGYVQVFDSGKVLWIWRNKNV